MISHGDVAQVHDRLYRGEWSKGGVRVTVRAHTGAGAEPEETRS